MRTLTALCFLGATMALASTATAQTAARSPIVFGRPIVVGSLPRELVLRYARRSLPELSECFAPRPGRPKPPAGELTVKLSVARSGLVLDAEVSGTTIPSKTLSRCVLRVVESWRFGCCTGAACGLSFVELPIRHAP